jgi:predicted  nucleic acid-binding Zn-ribbon protein
MLAVGCLFFAAQVVVDYLRYRRAIEPRLESAEAAREHLRSRIEAAETELTETRDELDPARTEVERLETEYSELHQEVEEEMKRRSGPRGRIDAE